MPPESRIWGQISLFFSSIRTAWLANWARLVPLPLLAGLLVGGVLQPAFSQNSPVLTEHFEGPTSSWRQPRETAGAKILAQQRIRLDRSNPSDLAAVDSEPAESTGVEWLRFACPAGYSGLFLQPIGRAPVIDELRISLDYRGATSGAQLAVRVVLPRSNSTTIGRAEQLDRSMIIRAPARYQEPGVWQTLTIENLPLLVKRQARLLRAQAGVAQAAGAHSIDERGAYVDHVALIVPGSSPSAEFWTDDLIVEGVLSEELEDSAEGDSKPDAASVISERETEVTISSSGFELNRAGFFPRIWRQQQEPMEAIRRLGFSAVAFDAPPTAEQLSEAQQRSLAVFCPAPSSQQLDELRSQLQGERLLDNLLGWVLPGQQSRLTLDAAGPEIARLRNHPLLATRPLIAAPRDGFAAWSRRADALVLDGSHEQSKLADALQNARPGTPAIARISLDWSPQAMNQLKALAPAGKAGPWRTTESIEHQAWAAVALGAKGLWFDSQTPLLGAGADERRIAATVELLNLKLALVEPWLVTNDALGAVLDANREPVAAVFDRARTKVVIGHNRAIRSGRAGQAMLVVPGVSETASVYVMTPAGLAPLNSRRTLGGIAIESAAVAPGEFLLLTDDRAAVRDIQRRIARLSARAVELQQQLIVAELSEWETLVAETAALAETPRRSSLAAIVKQQISRSKAAQATGDWSTAYQACSLARRRLSLARISFHKQLAPSNLLSSSSLVLQPSTWPDEIRLRQLIRALPREGNLLTGGDFEDLGESRQAGWRHTQIGGAGSGGDAAVELTTESPRHGERCLTLQSQAAGQRKSLAWITSPTTSLAAGQLVEITGWVRIAGDPDADGVSELKIVDSLGGEELSLSARQENGSDGWRPFHMLRRPTKSENLQLSFVLVGEGRASIDAVMIRPVRLAPPGQESNAASAQARREGEVGRPRYKK